MKIGKIGENRENRKSRKSGQYTLPPFYRYISRGRNCPIATAWAKRPVPHPRYIIRLMVELMRPQTPKTMLPSSISTPLAEDPERRGPAIVFTVEDPCSPTGYRVLQRCVVQPPRPGTGPFKLYRPQDLAR